MEGLNTVKEYCEYLGWSVSELARQAGVTWEPANNAYRGAGVSDRVKRNIVEAFSRAFGEKILVGDIEWQLSN